MAEAGVVELGIVSRDLAIDFGTAFTRVIVKNRGLVIDEPSVIAVDTRTREVLALGAEAADLVGRTADHIVTVRPLQQGAITDFDMAERMLRAILLRCGMTRMSRPRVLLTVPSAATSIERRALKQAAERAGAAKAYLIEAPIAAAIGLDLPIYDPTGSVVVDIGAGTTEAAVISLGGVVALKAMRIGGSDLDRAVVDAVRQRDDMVISEPVGEELKIRIGSVDPFAPSTMAEVQGHRVGTGIPTASVISTDEVRSAILDLAEQMVDNVVSCLAEAPPELAQDAIFEGIHFVGGTSGLHGMVELLSKGTAVPVQRSHNPTGATVEGAARCLDDIDRLGALFSEGAR
jgi:rod shape-determining protein MreB and related proteins